MPFLKLCGAFILLVVITGCQPAPEKVKKTIHAENGTYAADISDDGNYSLVSTDETGLLLWPRYATNAKYQWQHNENTVSQIIDVDISADGEVAVAASRKEFSMWDINNGENLGFWQIGSGEIQKLVVSKKVERWCLESKTVHRLLSTPPRVDVLNFMGIPKVLMFLIFRPMVLCSKRFKRPFGYSVGYPSGQIVHRWPLEGRITQVALHPDGHFAFISDAIDNSIIHSLPDGEIASKLKFIERHKIFSAARFSASGDYLITGSPSRQIAIWDTSTGEELTHWRVDLRDGGRPSNAAVLAVVFDEKQQQVISESSAGLAEWWNIGLTGSKE